MGVTHRVLILLVRPGLPDVPIVGQGPLVLSRTPLLPENSFSLILLPVQVGPVRQAGSPHHLPEESEGMLGDCNQAPRQEPEGQRALETLCLGLTLGCPRWTSSGSGMTCASAATS